jgi:hypothetical protein
MAVSYDVPAGMTLSMEGPCIVTTSSESARFDDLGVPTVPIIETYAPNPGPVGVGPFGFSITGNFFHERTAVTFDGVPAEMTDVFSQWTITGTGPMRETAGTVRVALLCDGIEYVPFDWDFGDPVEPPVEPVIPQSSR